MVIKPERMQELMGYQICGQSFKVASQLGCCIEPNVGMLNTPASIYGPVYHPSRSARRQIVNELDIDCAGLFVQRREVGSAIGRKAA